MTPLPTLARSCGTRATLVAAICLASFTMAFSLAPEANAQSWADDGYLEPGTIGFRAGLGLRTFTITTTDEEGNESTETGFGGSFLVGGSYALLSRIALDLDTDVFIDFSPEFELDQVAVTPGTRLFVLPGLYGRLAAVNYVLSPTNTLALVGVGYFTSTGTVSFFIEINYVAWAKDDEGVPVIIPRLGVSVGF